jgi:serine/threonine-protein kinase
MNCPSCGKPVEEGQERCEHCQQPLAESGLAAATATVHALPKLVLEDRYRVDEFIDRGGMGRVYRGTDLLLERAVAIKFLDDHLAHDGDFVARFRREAMAMAKMDHPNVVPIYSVSKPDGSQYFVMKFISGRKVSDLIRAHGRLPPAEALRIVRQVCDGLEHIHGRGFVHRDIKPSNLMIEEGGQVYILDFGILRQETVGATKTTMMAGTPDYMAPEQARDPKNVTARSDLYSLGAVLFEMLTGRVPFHGDSAFDTVLRHLNEAPSKVTSLVPELPEKIDTLVLRALEKNPAERYGSAAEMRRVVTQLLGEIAPAAAPAEALGRTLTLSAGAAAARTPTSEVRASSIHGEASGITARPRRNWRWLAVAAGVGAVGIAVTLFLRGGNEPEAPLRVGAGPPAAAQPEIVPAPAAPAPPSPSVVPPALPAEPPGPPPAEAPKPAPSKARVQRSVPSRRLEPVAVAAAPAPAVAPAVLPPPAPPPPSPPKRGTLTVIVRHEGQLSWAQLEIGGKPLGNTSVEEKRAVPAGRQVLRVRRPGYETQEKAVTVAPGEHQEIVFELRRKEP